MGVGSLVSAMGHMLLMTHQFMLDTPTPYWLLITANISIGLGYCMVASSIWTLLSYTVSDEDANIAYGMIQSFQHVGIIFTSCISGQLVDNAIVVTTGYFHS